MLKGYLIYNDEHKGPVTYNVFAQDSFDSFKLHLQADDKNFTAYQNANFVFDSVVAPVSAEQVAEVSNPYLSQSPSDTRRLDIKKTNKYKSNITNRVFCSRVAALIRYAQLSGSSNYNQNLSEQDHFAVERLVNIDDIGFILYEMALIRELNLKNSFVELVLTTVPDDTLDVAIFKELKAKDKYGNSLSVTPIDNVGFKLHADLLGFPYEPPLASTNINLLGMYDNIEQVIASNPTKNTSWILDRHYEIVTHDNLTEVLEAFNAFDGWIAFDTETTGLKINFKSRTGEADQLVGVILSMKEGTGYYFPLQHKLFPNLCNGDHWFFMERYMRPILETKKIICHNLNFDWKVAYIYGIVVNCLYDTQLAFGVTKRYELPSFELGLKALVRNLLGLDMFDLSDFVLSSSFSDSGVTFADLPYELVRRYAPADGDMTLALFYYLEHHGILAKYNAQAVFDMEVNFAKVVAYSEFWGYHINVAKVPEMHEAIVTGMEKYKTEMFALAGKEFNPNSPVQLSKIMYDELGIEQIGDSRSTAKDILRSLADRTDTNGEPLYPFVVALKNYRDNEGLFKNFLKRLHEFATPDGFIFPDVFQLGTDTGRCSVKDPNYQSYNDPIKKNITPREGYFHFDSDFSQIEYRVLASMAKQESLMKEFDDPDLDYHTYQASRMFSIPYSLVSKALRNQSKGINFGLPYGMGDNSLGARIFGERTKENERKASVLRRKFFQGQEKIEDFFERTRSLGVSNNYTATYWGRRRYYNRGKFNVGEIRRQAGNHVIQGTAADIYKLATNRLWNRCLAEGWLDKVLFNVFVHDELLVEIHQSINPYYFFKAWRQEFELVVEGFCKLYAGAGVGQSWYEAKKQDLPVQYITEIIDTYQEDMDWDENIPVFLDSIKSGYQDYKIRRVKTFITDPQNTGEVIKPVIYALLVELVDQIVAQLQQAPEAVKLLKDYNAALGKELLPAKGRHKIKLLTEYLAVFGRFHNISEQIVGVISAEEAATQTTRPAFDEEAEDTIVFSDDTFTLEDYVEFGHGLHLDLNTSIIYFKDQPLTMQGVPTTVSNYLIHQKIVQNQGPYRLAYWDDKTQTFILSPAYLSNSGYQLMRDLYANLRKVSQAPMMYSRTTI